ncbi:MAG: hypothetical protein H5U37_03265 [Caldisericia bacterium]|nr:hypothetical protein [Caldisericia bacterium]
MKKILVSLIILGLNRVNENLAIENFLNNSQQVIINNSEPIIKISDDNYLEEFDIDLVDIKTIEDDIKTGGFLLISKFKIELKRKKLDESLANLYKTYAYEELKNVASSVGHWDTTFTQIYDREIYFGGPNGYYDFVHFLTATGRIDYLDSQYIATNMWFKYIFLSLKYSEPNPYKQVGGWSTYYQSPYNYPYPTRYTTYSYNNNEIYWRDIHPESAYCWTHFEVNLKRGGTTWATYVNFKISGSQIIIETEPGTYPD